MFATFQTNNKTLVKPELLYVCCIYHTFICYCYRLNYWCGAEGFITWPHIPLAALLPEPI